jgi:2-octaprenylphenol hydroxylase
MPAMNEQRAYDVVVCGGGLVGLALALALAPTSLRIALLDPQPLPCVPEGAGERPEFDPRVSALTPASRQLLEGLGLWPALEALRVSPYTDMHVWDADGTGAVHFSAAELHEPCLGYIVENGLVAGVMAEALRQLANVEVLQDSLESCTSSQGGQTLTFASGARITCRLLVGADGSASRVRTLAGIDTKEWDTGHRAIVATVRTAQPHQHTAWQRFLHTGPLAFLPLQQPVAEQQQHSSIVWSCVPELAGELLALDDEAFASRLELAFERRLGAVEHVSSRHAFPLWQKHAGDYVRDGLALIGDAAHTIHPLAGQGVNLGLADVKSLAAVLSRAAARGEDIGSEQVLSRYQRERKAANLGMLLMMEGFKRAFGSDNLHLRWLRNAGLKAADGLRPLKQVLMKGAMGL